MSGQKMLRNDEEPWTTLCLYELAKVARHRRLVVRHKDPVIVCGTGENVGVSHAR
jgi:hypothetical protein